MIRLMVSAAALSAGFALPATAQTRNGGFQVSNVGVANIVPGGAFHNLYRSAITPTMRRQREDRIIALRSEVAFLTEQDGGTLSASNERYLIRKARSILGIR